MCIQKSAFFIYFILLNSHSSSKIKIYHFRLVVDITVNSLNEPNGNSVINTQHTKDYQLLKVRSHDCPTRKIVRWISDSKITSSLDTCPPLSSFTFITTSVSLRFLLSFTPLLSPLPWSLLPPHFLTV